jgi:HrpA-like RNA helicase
VKKGILKDFDIRPLYAAMPPDEQLSAFASAPIGVRKFVLSTNIAETSVTISGEYIYI